MNADPRAMLYPCPNCQSPIGKKCTQLTDAGRREATARKSPAFKRQEVNWFHAARLALIQA